MTDHIHDSRLIKSIAATLEGFARDIREGDASPMRADVMAPMMDEMAWLLRAQAVKLEAFGSAPPREESIIASLEHLARDAREGVIRTNALVPALYDAMTLLRWYGINSRKAADE